MIRLENVVKKYGDTLAVDNLSFEVPEGKVCVIIGPSGCGKTTTLRMINRLVEPTSGMIYVNGEEIHTTRPQELRRSIGYAIQNVGLFPHMTVAQNIAVVPQLLKWEKPRTAERIEELLELVGLDSREYAVKYPAQLSGGEAQRIGVARALAANPPILLMDEPFGAVDPLTREKLQTQFIKIQKELNKTVIIVTHDLDEAIRLGDGIVIMNAGRLVQYDSPEEILARPVNKFVHDFVGTDRALKRLSRISIKDIVQPSRPLPVSTTIDEAREICADREWTWVVDENDRLIGWLDMKEMSGVQTVKDALVKIDPDTIAVSENSTLRETLSRMLGEGLKSVPVIDDNAYFIGEVTLREIEAATAEPGA